jgi:hypothetical protein
MAGEIIKVWITRYALTDGIMEGEAQLCETSGGMIKFKGNYYHGEHLDWHRTKESAITRAEERRKAKLASLKRQIAKLEKLDFSRTEPCDG